MMHSATPLNVTDTESIDEDSYAIIPIVFRYVSGIDRIDYLLCRQQSTNNQREHCDESRSGDTN